jgi:hypothetical protein
MPKFFLQGIVIFFFCLANLSCSGYVMGKRSNPFLIYGVESVSVPAFTNDTPVPDVGLYVGQEVVSMLAEFPELKLAMGENLSTDAVLIGRITSAPTQNEAITNSQYLSSNAVAPINAGFRNPFLVPSANSTTMVAEFTLMTHKGKILWSKSLPYSTRYTVELYDGEASSVIVTQTLENARRSYRNAAKDLAQNLRSLVIDAF